MIGEWIKHQLLDHCINKIFDQFGSNFVMLDDQNFEVGDQLIDLTVRHSDRSVLYFNGVKIVGKYNMPALGGIVLDIVFGARCITYDDEKTYGEYREYFRRDPSVILHDNELSITAIKTSEVPFVRINSITSFHK